jgi:hypothetical protein
MVKRMPWDGTPEPKGPSTPMTLEDLPEEMRGLLLVRPRRNPDLEWLVDEETELVTIIYPKNFTKIERSMGRIFKPVEELHRPLDGPGSDIWLLCDGDHNIAHICTAIDDKYKEVMEPVLKRVVGFIEMLASRGLLILERDKDESKQEG